MITFRLPAAALAAGLTLAQAAPSAQAPSARPALGTFGIDTAQMDPAVKPGDDFFRYVNGKWLATAAIPADKARYGMFDALRDKAEADVRALVDELGRTPAPAGTVRQKVADLYASWMDEARIEARGLEPLRADLAAIDAAATKTDLIRLMGRLEFSAPFAFGITADPAEPTRYVVTIGQAGLGMPVRDYYLSPGGKFDGYRAAYKTYVDPHLRAARRSGAGGERRDGDRARNEARPGPLAGRQAPRREGDEQPDGPRRPDRGDSGRRLAGGARPERPWRRHASSCARSSAIKGGAALLDTEPVAAWKKYLAFHLPTTPATISRRPSTTPASPSTARPSRGVAVQRNAGSAASTARRPDRRSRRRALRRQVLPARRRRRRWTRSSPTCATAMGERLEDARLDGRRDEGRGAGEARHVRPEDRLPDEVARLLRRSTSTRGARSATSSAPRVRVAARDVAQLGKPVDRDEWGMTPQTVNAYYNPAMNEIVFPAAILQPPFFDPNADAAVNYGAHRRA